MINKIIRNYIAKRMAGRSDDGIMITLKDPQRVTLGENIMADLLMRNGIDPRAITSEAQLKTILQQIENAEAAAIRNTGIRNTESAKVFNIEGQKLDPNKPIIGGTQTGKELSPELSERLRGTNTERIKQKIADKKIDDDLPPPGSRGGPDDIAAPVMNVEDAPPGFIDFVRKTDPEGADKLQKVEDEIKAAIEAGNKRAAENLRKKKKKKDDDPEKKAEGGIMRLGLKEGSGMTRRTFLKFLAGAASIPIIGKIFKPLKVGKTVTKVPIIKTADVPGKPEWFDQLVNKVILEGDDFTKKLATGERQVVHVKKLDEDTTVSVTQDMDNGVVRVEYDSPANTFEDTVQLQYKKPLPDEGSPNPAAEFEVAESGPVGRVQGPDDFDIDIDEVGGTSIKDLDSDVSKLKEYATGEKPNMKELLKNIERRKRARQITEDPEAQSDAVIRRQGDYDPSDYDDFASGGIARMLGE
jgi:hypothetical protein